MRINGRRGLMSAELSDLEWRNVKQCYANEIAYGMRTIDHEDQRESWAGYKGSWGEIGTGPAMWQGRMNNWKNAEGVLLDGPYPDFRNSPYWIKQPDGTYLFTPSLFKAGIISKKSDSFLADSQWFLVHKQEPTDHK